MPWTARLGERVIDMRGERSIDRVAMHEDRSIPWRCRGCGGAMLVRSYDGSLDLDRDRFRYFTDTTGPFVAFAHRAGEAEACRELGFHCDESVQHLDLKHELCVAAARKGWSHEVEVYHKLRDGTPCRADVVVTRDGEKPRVLEAQVSPLGPDEAIRRTQLYQEAFGKVLWTHTRQRPWSRRLPSLRVDDGEDTDNHLVIGGVFSDQGCVNTIPPSPLVDVVGRVLPPDPALRWVWVAEEYGGFVRLGGDRRPLGQRRPVAPSGRLPAGANVRECAADPIPEDGPFRDLVIAWIKWDAAPSAAWTTAAKFDAIRALEFEPVRVAEAVSAYRRQGYSVSDAVEAAVNDQRSEAG